MKNKKKILLLGNDASLTGAPIIFKQLMSYLVNEQNWEVKILLMKGGQQLEEFKQLGDVYIKEFNVNESNFFQKMLIRLLPVYRIRNRYLKLQLEKFNPDVVLCHTIVTGPLLDLIEGIKAPVLTMVYELEYVIRLFNDLGMNDSRKVIQRSDYFLAASDAVKDNLILNHNIFADNVETVYNSNSQYQALKEEPDGTWRRRNGIPKDAFVVGACGWPSWRKGTDLFLSVAKEVNDLVPNKKFFFVWQGGSRKQADFIQFEIEAKKLGVEDITLIIPEVSDTHEFYNNINVLLSTSREEPFGTVLLEAGMYRKPIVAFENAGGAEEILNKRRGLLVPYGDAREMSKAIFKLEGDKELNKELSSNFFLFLMGLKNNDSRKKVADILQGLSSQNSLVNEIH